MGRRKTEQVQQIHRKAIKQMGLLAFPKQKGPGLKFFSFITILAKIGTAQPPTHPIVHIEVMAVNTTLTFNMGSPRRMHIAAHSQTALEGTFRFGWIFLQIEEKGIP